MSSTATDLSLKAEVREERGKEWAKKARAKDVIPGVVYGPGGETTVVAVSRHDLLLLYNATIGVHKFFDLEVSNGEKCRVFIKDIQKEPVTDLFVHVDFMRVQPDTPVRVKLQVRQTGGTPEGVRAGGIIERVRFDLGVEGKPDDIPGNLEADLTDLHLGEAFKVKDLPEQPGLSYVQGPETVLFACIAKGKEAKAAAKELEGGAAAEGEEAEGEQSTEE